MIISYNAMLAKVINTPDYKTKTKHIQVTVLDSNKLKTPRNPDYVKQKGRKYSCKEPVGNWRQEDRVELACAPPLLIKIDSPDFGLASGFGPEFTFLDTTFRQLHRPKSIRAPLDHDEVDAMPREIRRFRAEHAPC